MEAFCHFVGKGSHCKFLSWEVEGPALCFRETAVAAVLQMDERMTLQGTAGVHPMRRAGVWTRTG